jgi:CubicO group peptidase (beta-lactamase class C family)
MSQATISLNDLGLFTGAPQYENFARLKSLVRVAKMKASTRPRPFPEGPSIELPTTYDYGGKTHELAAFLAETRTTALLILRDGEVRHEQYWLTGGREVQWISFSVAKSFVSALVGVALSEGAIQSIEDPIDAYASALKDSAYGGVRIKDVLQMSSGARWNENYNDPASEVFGLGAAMGPGGSLDAFVSTRVNELKAGLTCRYNSGDTQALGMLIAAATGRSVTDYMQEKLSEPLGMEYPGYWLVDSRGREMVFAGLNLTARDFAKLGELYRNGGRIAGLQIVPENWVSASTRPDGAHVAPGMLIARAGERVSLGYGYQWWILPGARGQFTAMGVYNQFIFVDPSRGLVIVKLSANPAYGTSPGEETNKDYENVSALEAIAQSFDGHRPTEHDGVTKR